MPDAIAVLEHRLPGRMRLRVRNRRGDEAFFREMLGALTATVSVQEVRSNPATASILVSYSGQESAVLNTIRACGLDVRETAPPTVVVVRRSNPVTMPTALDVAAVGLATAGAVQLARGQVVGSASENLWNAFGLYAVTRQRWIPLILVALGLRQVMRGELLGSAVSLFLYALSARRLAQHRGTEDTI